MNIREFKKICKIDTEIITDITADDTVSKILNRPTKYPITSLQKTDTGNFFTISWLTKRKPNLTYVFTLFLAIFLAFLGGTYAQSKQ